MLPQRLRIAFTLVGFVTGLGAEYAAPPEYKITFLPVTPGCQSVSQVHGMDEQGRVLGALTCDGFLTQRAVMWERGTLVELGTFGGPNSFPYGLSQRGEVVGYVETSEVYGEGEHVWRPFLWADGNLRDLGTLGGHLGAAASMNQGGTIVGICQPADLDPRLLRTPTRACTWENGGVNDLGDLGGPESFATDINSRGSSVGYSNTNEPLPSGLGFLQHAFLHDGQGMRDLGTLGGLESGAISLNDRGDIVGWSLTRERWRNGYPIGQACLWRDGSPSELPSLGGPFSMALDINGDGQIVGLSYSADQQGHTQQRAVLWDRGLIVNLSDVVEELGGWNLLQATAIDARERILVNAYRDGESRVVLLTPTGRK
jgi:probable HAF family extracellular repeat protein